MLCFQFFLAVAYARCIEDARPNVGFFQHQVVEWIFDAASYFAFLPRSGGKVMDEKLPKLIDSLSPSIKDRIKRLDTVEQISGEGTGGAPGSAQYSPLTVTSTSLSMNLGRQSIGGAMPPPTDLDKARTGGTFRGLMVAAAVLVVAIVAYVFFYLGGQ